MKITMKITRATGKKFIALFFISFSFSCGAQVDTTSNSDEVNDGIFKIYGNWCGPDHPKSIGNASTDNAPEPIDDLDAICMRHDYCYIKQGALDCGCDKILRAELDDAILAGKFEGAQIHYARTMKHYFAGSPCNGDGEGKIGPSRLLHKAVGVAKDTTGGIINRVTDIVPGLGADERKEEADNKSAGSENQLNHSEQDE